MPVSQVVIAHRDHNGAVILLHVMRDYDAAKTQAEEALRHNAASWLDQHGAGEEYASGRVPGEHEPRVAHAITSILGLAEALQSRSTGR